LSKPCCVCIVRGWALIELQRLRKIVECTDASQPFDSIELHDVKASDAGEAIR
jgi:hypothetical protein